MFCIFDITNNILIVPGKYQGMLLARTHKSVEHIQLSNSVNPFSSTDLSVFQSQEITKWSKSHHTSLVQIKVGASFREKLEHKHI